MIPPLHFRGPPPFPLRPDFLVSRTYFYVFRKKNIIIKLYKHNKPVGCLRALSGGSAGTRTRNFVIFDLKSGFGLDLEDFLGFSWIFMKFRWFFMVFTSRIDFSRSQTIQNIIKHYRTHGGRVWSAPGPLNLRFQHQKPRFSSKRQARSGPIPIYSVDYCMWKDSEKLRKKCTMIRQIKTVTEHPAFLKLAKTVFLCQTLWSQASSEKFWIRPVYSEVG